MGTDKVRYISPKDGWSTKRKLFIAAIIIFLIATLAVLVAILLKTLVFDEASNASQRKPATCGGIPCVHGSCHCTETERRCVCFGNYTGKSCDTIKPAECEDEKCLRRRGPPGVDDGWYSPGVEYEYLLTKSRTTWSRARKICQQYGGDLAMLGIRNRATRIATALKLNRGSITWIGLKRENQSWTWVNGDNPYNVYWLPDQPNLEPESNCGVIDGSINLYSTENFDCKQRFHGLCEKKV